MMWLLRRTRTFLLTEAVRVDILSSKLAVLYLASADSSQHPQNSTPHKGSASSTPAPECTASLIYQRRGLLQIICNIGGWARSYLVLGAGPNDHFVSTIPLHGWVLAKYPHIPQHQTRLSPKFWRGYRWEIERMGLSWSWDFRRWRWFSCLPSITNGRATFRTLGTSCCQINSIKAFDETVLSIVIFKTLLVFSLVELSSRKHR